MEKNNMTFSDELKAKLRPTYRSKNLANLFYKPILKEAKLYRRVSAYFSSAGLELYSQGLKELFNNGGHAQFIISTDISKDDFKKIQDGYALRNQLKSLPLNLKDKILNYETEKNLGNLAFMIAQGRAEVKFAMISKEHGIFHDKFGIISSDQEDIFFTGSANETKSGLQYNYESISVDVSWDKSKNVNSRIEIYGDRFNRLWNNGEENIAVYDATELVYEEIAKYQEKSNMGDIKKLTKTEEETSLNDFDGVYFRLKNNNTVVRDDYTDEKITSEDRRLKYDRSDLPVFFEVDNTTIKSNTSYIDVNHIIELTRKRCLRKKIDVKVSQGVKTYLARSKYSIMQYQILGRTLKDKTRSFKELKGKEFADFAKTIQSRVKRPLRESHLRAAYYEYRMARAANFSVPGAGKTAMILGLFAYLNKNETVIDGEKVNRILVVSPINAFESWKSEFCKVFGKEELVI